MIGRLDTLRTKGRGLILPWIAASTNHAGLAFPFPALPGTHYSWVGWSNVSNVSCSRKHNQWCCLAFPNYNTAGSNGAMANASNIPCYSKQQCWGSNQDHRQTPNHLCHCASGCDYPEAQWHKRFDKRPLSQGAYRLEIISGRNAKLLSDI